MERIAGNSSVGTGRSRLHHKRRPGHRRNTQHSVATIEPICDMRKVVNGMVSVDQEKLHKLVQKDPIELHYAVEAEPFASGLFATVRKCRHRATGIEYAAKYASKLRFGQDCTAEILHEIALMSLCTTTPRIIHLIDVFDTPTHMILVMEYAPGGDLQTLMDDDMVPYEKDAVKFVRQVLEGLLFLHERNLAHLDIKLQNVLLMGTFPDCDVKLCDLEISRVIVAGQEVRELLGTPDYVSPEILHYEPITLSADIWSVGVMAYVLLTGFTPFGGDTDQETFHNICHGQLDFPEELFEDISPQAEDFIRKTLDRSPSCRPTVRECLKHPWLTVWKNVASHQRETISSEGQRKSSSAFGPSAAPACPRSVSTSSIGGQSSLMQMSRSLQRAMSKSREVLCERVAASNLRKSTSKSRERLCEMKLNFSRSRDHLCDLLQSSAGQSRERFQSLRNLSKSHEVLSLLSEQRPELRGLEQHHFNHVPLTQSLECFSIPSPDVEKASVVEETLNQASVDVNHAVSKNFNESTETLCEETQVPVADELSDDITPSNSRSETPTREEKNDELAMDSLEDSASPPDAAKPTTNEPKIIAPSITINLAEDSPSPTVKSSDVFKLPETNSEMDGINNGLNDKPKDQSDSSPASPPDDETVEKATSAASEQPRSPAVEPLDASPLTEAQRQLLNVCLNRRRASWACGRQEPHGLEVKLPDAVAVKKSDSKLSVSELISSFNRGDSKLAKVENSSSVKHAKLSKPSFDKTEPPGAPFAHKVTEKLEKAHTAAQKGEGSSRMRLYHPELRALPGLPEDSDCTSPKEEAKNDADETRSGSVSSDTGCSSSSDISDRSSDDNLDRECRFKGGAKKDSSGVSQKEEEVRFGRPRSLSVQADASLLAQPWNRVCVGSLARAFEKFGTRVEPELQGRTDPQQPPNLVALRCRRQSTPGPLK